jgi:hypothetical protein
VLVVDLGQIVPALRSLERSAGMRSDPMAFANGNRTSKSVGRSSPVRLVLERRKFELGMTSQAMATEAWKAPLKTCSETPTKKVVFVNSDLTVQNKMEMLDWAEKSSKCTSDAAVWIKQETAGPEGIAGLDPARLGSWTVYNFVSKVMPTGLVPGDDSRVAVLPRFSVESASKINPDLSGSSNLQ